MFHPVDADDVLMYFAADISMSSGSRCIDMLSVVWTLYTLLSMKRRQFPS